MHVSDARIRSAAELRIEWGEITKALPGISGSDVASVVDDVVDRIRARRREIEAASAIGRA